MTFAVVAHPGDVVAVDTAMALERRLGSESVVLAWAEELMLAPVWCHHLDRSVDTDIVLRDGRRLDSGALAGVFCRLRYAPAPLFARSAARDRDYAAAEGYALLLSWLAGLSCPVINRPSSLGLSGPQMTLVQWLALGARCGLPVQRVRRSSRGQGRLEPLGAPVREVHVVGNRVIGGIPRATAEGCCALGQRTGCSVLGLRFGVRRGSDDPVLCGVDTSPTLSSEGVEAAVDLLTA